MATTTVTNTANRSPNNPKVQTAVVGVGGYSGAELARLLLHHPKLDGKPPVFAGRPETASAKTGSPVALTTIHPRLMDNNGSAGLVIEPFSWQLFELRGVEVLFLATPHEQSREWAPEAIERGIRVIDLSGAWRLNDARNRAVYKFDDEGAATTIAVQAKSVYGMPELHRNEIPAAQLIANPGCYATSIILALKPLIEKGLIDLDRGIVCDSKSGVSGAGKAPTAKTHFMYAADNLSAYGVFGHRHTGELLEQLEIQPEQIVFTPHLLPIPRGILSTIYVWFKEETTQEKIETIFNAFFANSPMVRIFRNGELPQIQYSAYTNYCDIGFQLAEDGKRCVIVSCLDNLLKGAASQAVQNLNLMCGWNEAEGLA
jgi:N-acetyl-gamma-glutamyl-phosphate reductase